MKDFMHAIGLHTYQDYMTDFQQWVATNTSSTPGNDESLAGYTKLNLSRSKRLEQTVVLKDELKVAAKKLTHRYTLMVITESWCGDSAQNLPVVAAIAASNPDKIQLMILLRNQHPALMDAYLTDGSRAIPKIIGLDETMGNEAFTWGPRPAPAQALLHSWKHDPNRSSWESFERELHTWYAKDKTKTLQAEWLSILEGLY
jgi:hypothetical protein